MGAVTTTISIVLARLVCSICVCLDLCRIYCLSGDDVRMADTEKEPLFVSKKPDCNNDRLGSDAMVRRDHSHAPPL